MGLRVLSLFDGMSCGQLALQRLGIEVDTYYASEIDKYAIQVTQANFPETIQVGDVCELKAKDYQDIDLILAGSPCQGFSFAGKQLAFDDPRSALFFEFVRLLKEIKPKYFLLENVRMKQQFQDVITEQVSACYPDFEGGDLLGSQIKPILINSALLSAQNRERLYWTNILGVEQPKDKGIVLKDILIAEEEWQEEVPQYLKNHFHGEPRANQVRHIDAGKSKTLTASMYKGQIQTWIKKDSGALLANKPNQVNPSKKASGRQPYMQDRVFHEDGKSHSLTASFASRTNVATKPKQVGIAADINGHDILKRVYSPEGKSPTLNSMGGGNREPKVAIKNLPKGSSGKSWFFEQQTYLPDSEKTRALKSSSGSGNIPKLAVEHKDHDISIELEQGHRLEEYDLSEVANERAKNNPRSRAFKPNQEKSGALLANQHKQSTDSLYALKNSNSGDKLTWRKLTPVECERLQTVPDNYTNHVSNTQRYKMLGNGWTVEVIAHILSNMKL